MSIFIFKGIAKKSFITFVFTGLSSSISLQTIGLSLLTSCATAPGMNRSTASVSNEVLQSILKQQSDIISELTQLEADRASLLAFERDLEEAQVDVKSGKVTVSWGSAAVGSGLLIGAGARLVANQEKSLLEAMIKTGGANADLSVDAPSVIVAGVAIIISAYGFYKVHDGVKTYLSSVEKRDSLISSIAYFKLRVTQAEENLKTKKSELDRVVLRLQNSQ